jgi:hypothetical protein
MPRRVFILSPQVIPPRLQRISEPADNLNLLNALVFLSLSVIPSRTIIVTGPYVSPEQAVWEQARHLSDIYGSKPPYQGPEFDAGERLTSEQALHTAPYILACESRAELMPTSNGCIIDSNHKLSCGPGQFQDWSTFWEPASGIYGDPNVSSTAVRMLLWGLESGYVGRWSCSAIEHVIIPPSRQ